MKSEIKVKFEDLINTAKYIEKHCDKSDIKIDIGLHSIKFECSDVTIKISSKDANMFPRVFKEERLENQE